MTGVRVAWGPCWFCSSEGWKWSCFHPGLHSICDKSLKMGMMPPALPRNRGTRVKDVTLWGWSGVRSVSNKTRSQLPRWAPHGAHLAGSHVWSTHRVQGHPGPSSVSQSESSGTSPLWALCWGSRYRRWAPPQVACSLSEGKSHAFGLHLLCSGSAA